MAGFTESQSVAVTNTVQPNDRQNKDRPAVDVRDVYFAYRHELTLSGVSFSVPEGQFVSIIGPSGCGKSTLLNLIQGLLPVSYGDIRVAGELVDGPSGNRAMIFQQFALLPWKTVRKNILLGLKYGGHQSRPDRERAAEKYMRLIGLTKYRDMYPHQLSGGMQQRVAIARALALEPAVLLLDEPFAALDAQNAEIMRGEVSRLVSDQARTAILVTHNLDEALQLSDRILVMGSSSGLILEDISLVPARSSLGAGVDWAFSTPYHELRDRLWGMLQTEVMGSNSIAMGAR